MATVGEGDSGVVVNRITVCLLCKHAHRQRRGPRMKDDAWWGLCTRTRNIKPVDWASSCRHWTPRVAKGENG
jgi:hypothetical protein